MKTSEKRLPYVHGLKIPNRDREILGRIKQSVILKNKLFLLKRSVTVQDNSFDIPSELIEEQSNKNIPGLLLLHMDIPMEFSKTPKKIWLYLNKEGRIGLFSLETDTKGVVWTNTQWDMRSPSNFKYDKSSFEHNTSLYLIDEKFEKTVKMLVNNGIKTDTFNKFI